MRAGDRACDELDEGPHFLRIVHAGERMPHVMSGPATYRTIERSAAAKSGVLEYHEYAAGGLHVTYECRGAEGIWEVSEGREADPAEIEILA